MRALIQSVSQIFKGAVKAFRAFPAAVACALCFAIVTAVRIELDWPEQETYEFLLDSLLWSLALGSIFSLAAITLAYSRFSGNGALTIANILGFACAAATFILLYFLGGSEVEGIAGRVVLSGLAIARVIAAIVVSFLSFIVLAGYPEDRSDFARSFFMTHKAFFIALLYGLVIMSGLSGVAGAIQALLYREMSHKVYMYIADLSGFVAFTIFVGYFPDFRNRTHDERRDSAQKQPRFIEILFGSIMIPITLALIAVLLIWACKIAVTGSWPSFTQLFGIAASYAGCGVWLHVMVTHYDSPLAKFYRRVYPVATLIILAFEAWALFVQLGRYGLKITEYFFILMWIAALGAAVLLLLKKAKGHTFIVALVCSLAVLSVLPAVGYKDAPVAAQANRLEKLLSAEGMLKDGVLSPAETEPDLETREAITDAVIFLSNAKDAKLPAWFDKELADGNVFRETLGFEQRWPGYGESPGGGPVYLGTYLTLPNGALDITGYRWALVYPQLRKEASAPVSVEGVNGRYLIYWTVDYATGIPTLRVELDERVILEQDMSSYLEKISEKFPPVEHQRREADIEDMCLRLETPEANILLVFGSVSISTDTGSGTVSYWMELDALYLNENI